MAGEGSVEERMLELRYRSWGWISSLSNPTHQTKSMWVWLSNILAGRCVHSQRRRIWTNYWRWLMIIYGAEKIRSLTAKEYVVSLPSFLLPAILYAYLSFHRLLINEAIGTIIQRREEWMIKLNSKYKGLSLKTPKMSSWTRWCSRGQGCLHWSTFLIPSLSGDTEWHICYRQMASLWVFCRFRSVCAKIGLLSQ